MWRFYSHQTERLGGFATDDLTLDEINREIIEHTIGECNGNQSLAARRLGISRSTIWRILGSARQKNMSDERNK